MTGGVYALVGCVFMIKKRKTYFTIAHILVLAMSSLHRRFKVVGLFPKLKAASVLSDIISIDDLLSITLKLI